VSGSKTDAFEQRILNLVFKNTGTSLTALANTYVGLFTVVPSDSSGGTEVTIGSFGYTRKSTSASDWTLTGSSITNANVLEFGAVITTGYTVVGWGIFDASTAGNLLYWGDTASTAMAVTDIPRFAAGAITITED
jgi:hypothetical protein